MSYYFYCLAHPYTGRCVRGQCNVYAGAGFGGTSGLKRLINYNQMKCKRYRAIQSMNKGNLIKRAFKEKCGLL